MAILENDLKMCRINFNRPVLVTYIMAEYDLKYSEVIKILQKFLDDQESRLGIKYQKSFVVHGEDFKGDHPKEIFKVVEESKLQEWLGILQKVQSSLYSVELVGNVPPPASTFHPHPIANNVKLRSNTKNSAPSTTPTQTDVKPDIPKPLLKTNANQKDEKKTSTNETDSKMDMNGHKKSNVKKKVSPKHQTVNGSTKSEKKKGITQFFTGAAIQNTSGNRNVVKDSVSKSAVCTKSPIVKEEINTSIQLFNADVELNKSEESDDDENCDALRRMIFSEEKDLEMQKSPATGGFKRRRISDSDLVDTDTSPALEDTSTSSNKCQSFVDEDGYLHTVRLNKNTRKASPQNASLKKKVKLSPRKPITVTKTKQAGIQNYFFKK